MATDSATSGSEVFCPPLQYYHVPVTGVGWWESGDIGRSPASQKPREAEDMTSKGLWHVPMPLESRRSCCICKEGGATLWARPTASGLSVCPLSPDAALTALSSVTRFDRDGEQQKESHAEARLQWGQSVLRGSVTGGETRPGA